MSPPSNRDLLLQVEAQLDALRPAMEADGGGVQLVSLTPTRLTLRLVGACLYCPSQSLTLGRAILPALREVVPADMEIAFA